MNELKKELLEATKSLKIHLKSLSAEVTENGLQGVKKILLNYSYSLYNRKKVLKMGQLVVQISALERKARG